MQKAYATLFITLLAAVTFSPATAQGGAVCSSVVDVLGASSDFSLLAIAVQQFPAIVTALSDPSLNATILAPTDDAINGFLNFTGISPSELLADEDLASILQYHVLPNVDLSQPSAFQTVTYVNISDITAANTTLANITTLEGVSFDTLEGSPVFLFSVDEDSVAAYFEIPSGSVVALSGINAAILDVENVITTCSVTIFPINSILIPEDVGSDAGNAYASASAESTEYDTETSTA